MKGSRIGAAVAVVAGLLAGPAVAFGGASLLSGDGSATTTVAAVSEQTTTTSTEAVTTTTTTAEVDLAAACGVDGNQMVAHEADGSATVVELAALDALRDVCAEAGTPLPDPPQVTMAASAPEEVVVVRTVEVTAPADTGTTTTVGYHDDDHDDDHEDDHGYEGGEHEDDHEDDHENDDGYEGGEHEDDD